MDRNFHNDDFERLLREKSNEFRMYPSKRIWHSIYNNIHPGRKWPSVAMSITLITALLLVGYLNTSNPNYYSSSSKSEVTRQKTADRNIAISSASSITADFATTTNETPDSSMNNEPPALGEDKYFANSVTTSAPAINFSVKNVPSNSPAVKSVKQAVASFKSSDKKEITPSNTTYNSKSIVVRGQNNIEKDNDLSISNSVAGRLMIAQQSLVNYSADGNFGEDIAIINVNNKISGALLSALATGAEKNELLSNSKFTVSTEDKNWIENYALYNRPATKKWANKLAWQLYATPSVVYRILYNDPNFGNANNNSFPVPVSAGNLDVNNAVNHTPSLGFEIGAGFQYSVFKGIKLKAGLQVNYTRYNARAFHNTHPVSTKLAMLDFKSNTVYEVQRATPYSNNNGLEAVKLHNQTVQLSLPIGADMKLIGNEELQWNFGVTLQPTYIVGGTSYLISADRRNYVKESSMLNRWNLNAGFETFLTFKSSNGLRWQVGPQFRTQLFSTNSRKFAVEERLVNYGLKFGVTKLIK